MPLKRERRSGDATSPQGESDAFVASRNLPIGWFAPLRRRGRRRHIQATRRRFYPDANCIVPAKMSQEKLAAKADLHPVFFGQVERGEQTVSVHALVRIAKALGIRLRDLVANV
jgi:DNA-binding XRE family transcriptional regulator